MSAAVLVSVAQTSSAVPELGVVADEVEAAEDAARARAPRAPAPPGGRAAAPPRGSTGPWNAGAHALHARQRRHQLARARVRGRGDALQALRPHERHVDGRRRHQQALVGADVGGGLGAADVLLARLQRQREARAGRRDRRVRPTMRPGIWRTYSMRVVMKPKYGPPEDSGTPSGWPSPTAMSAPARAPLRPAASAARARSG